MAMPVFPAAVRSDAIDVPIAFISCNRMGSMLGSVGSSHGGMNMREAYAPCWWTS